MMNRFLSVLVRQLRPWKVPIAVVLWITWSIGAWTTISSDNSKSFLEWIVHALQVSRQMIVRQLEQVPSSSSSPGSCSVLIILCQWIFRLLEDGLAILLVGQVLRVVYCLCHYTSTEWKQMMIDNTFFWARSNIPVVQAMVNKETASFVSSAQDMLHKDPDRILTLQLPTKGRSLESIVQELQSFANKENNTWQQGQTSGSVYVGDDPNNDTHTQLMTKVYGAYVWSNQLHAGLWPKVNQCEAEVIAMTADMLHAPQPYGCLSSGGTESIILAVRAHLNYYGKRRSITHPEIVCSTTAHASLDKACEMFGIRRVAINVNDPSNNNNKQNKTYTLEAGQVKKYITSNTIMIFASAPTFPHGCIDPIADLSQIALEYDIGLHVDSCLGGFVLPFCADAPIFDFRNKGVTSMSADTHKYGYASKGTSVVLYRSKDLRQSQYFAYPHWTGGLYVTPTIAGSRSGALAACAWASMVSIGKQGYQTRVKDIIQAARTIATGIQSIKGIQLLTAQPVFMMVCFGSNQDSDDTHIDIYRVADAMKDKGWSLNALQNPAAVNVCVTLKMVSKADLFLNDLRDAVEKVKSEGKEGHTKGSAGVYGTVGKLPDGPVECVLQAYTDMTLAP